LRKRCVFEEYDVAFYIAAISSALDHIHSKNIIHRDIKPENIILDERGYPYLTDFGVSHVQEQSTVQTTLTCTLASGTKQYLAPEVFTKTHIHGPEMDYWALGVVSYELLFGKRPFEKHCPIPFISYLEKAMSLKRRQQKEAKLRHLSSLIVNHASNDESNFIMASRENSRSSLIYDSHISPSQSLEILSPVATSSHKRIRGTNYKSSGNLNANDLPSNRTFSKNSNSCAPPARTMNSTELGSSSFDSQRELQFCSAVGVTNASGFCSSDNSGFSTPKKLLIGESSPSRYAMRQDSRYTSPASSQPPSPQATSVAAGSGKVSQFPDLKPPSRSQSPPKSLFGSSHNSPNSSMKRSSGKFGQRQPLTCNGIAGTDTEDYGDILPGGDAFDFGGLARKQSEYPAIYEEENEGEEDIREHNSPAKFIRAIPGDHWLVDDGILHPSLYVDIPESTSWLGPISLDCQRVLAGFFEVRPNHRLGARNMAALKRCRWFEKLRITDWEDLLHTKRFEPRFQPGKKFIRECLDRMDETGEAKVLGCDTSTYDDACNNLADLTLQPLTIEEEKAFESFYHVAAQHQDPKNSIASN
jgi:serine/threonine protein kinase